MTAADMVAGHVRLDISCLDRVLKRRTAALNLRNLISRGLTRRDGAWVLAT